MLEVVLQETVQGSLETLRNRAPAMTSTLAVCKQRVHARMRQRTVYSLFELAPRRLVWRRSCGSVGEVVEVLHDKSDQQDLLGVRQETVLEQGQNHVDK